MLVNVHAASIIEGVANLATIPIEFAGLGLACASVVRFLSFIGTKVNHMFAILLFPSVVGCLCSSRLHEHVDSDPLLSNTR